MEENLIINEIAFSQPVINIGSDRGNDIVLTGSGVSRFHAMLNYDSGIWNLLPLDLNARILVNDRTVDPSGCTLPSGSVLSIGGFRLKLTLNGVNADIIIEEKGGSEIAEALRNEEISSRNILLALGEGTPTEVEAGNSVEYELTVTNAGPLVANMQLQLQGVPASWVQIIPPVLNLNEGRRGVFIVRVTPPHSSEARAGLYQLHFVAISPNYPMETATANMVLTVLPYSDYIASGPIPRRITVSRSHQQETADIIIANNSNAPESFLVRANDDSNELTFSYIHEESVVQGQEIITVEPGEHAQVPIQITARKKPLLGITHQIHHYYANIIPSERPGDAQSLIGEVSVQPQFNTIWLLVILLILLAVIAVVFQPYVYEFSSVSGKHTEVILSGNSAYIGWHVSPFATTVTIDDGTESRSVVKEGTEYMTPTASTTYTIRAENIISRLFHWNHSRTMRVLLIPRRPTVDVFRTDIQTANYEQDVELFWAVSSNASSAAITSNKQVTPLTAETLSGNQKYKYKTDTLLSVKAQNGSGYDEKSVFINVRPDRIDLKRFIAWVRPSGIAIPEDNDVRRSTRWSSLMLDTNASQPQTIRPVGNYQPAPQSNTLEIPDSFMNVNNSSVNLNPEQQALAGQAQLESYVSQPAGSAAQSGSLLVSPSRQQTQPTAALAPVVEINTRKPVAAPTSAPAASPEYGSSAREFSVKLAEVVEDPSLESGYRTVSYFPEYVLQKGEQVLIEWEVEGVSSLKIENLTGDTLGPKGQDFTYPNNSVNLVLEAAVGNILKSFSLPLRVAGDPDDGQESGLKCELKANATELSVPGEINLTWTGGGNHRVQLISSAKAEEDTAKAEKEKEVEAKEKGESYTTPENNPMTGGTIGDYLQPSGFMRVNIDKQTTFILNAYDANNKIICTKSAVVNFKTGNDKKDLNFAIAKISDTDDVSQPFYTLGQTIQYTTRLWDFKKDAPPTGTIMVTDGYSTCSMTYPMTSCSMQAKHMGTLKITAVYSGDEVYQKKTATSYVRVTDKIDTETLISDVLKAAADGVDLKTWVKYDVSSNSLYKKYGKVPTGTITIAAGSGTCELDMEKLTLDCGGGTVTKSKNIYKVLSMYLTDKNAKQVRAKYNGDDYFNASMSDILDIETVPTKLDFMALKPIDQSHTEIWGSLSWDNNDNKKQLKPGGTISFKAGSGEACVLDLDKETLKCPSYMSVQIDPWSKGQNYLDFRIYDMFLEDPAAEMIKGEYSGDGYFEPSDTKTEFIKNTLLLEIVKVTDTEGREHGFYPATGYDAVVEVSLTEAGAKTAPTGKIEITVNNDPKSRCTLDWETETKCSLTLPKATGEAIPVTARYEGDALYGPRTAETTIEIRKKQDLAPVIQKITDAEGNEQDEYFKNQDIRVYVDLTDYLEDEIPTGKIEVKIGDQTCTVPIDYDDPDKQPTDKYCVLQAPSPAGSAIADQSEYDVLAHYLGNSFYNEAYAEKVKFIATNKHQIDLVVSGVTNECDESQPYYVYDPEADSGNGKGQTVKVSWGLTYDPSLTAPSGTISVWLNHDSESKKVCDSVNWHAGYCTFPVDKFTGEYTLIVHFDGDENFVMQDAIYENPFITHNRIKTVTTMKPGIKLLDDYHLANWEVGFSYSDKFADNYPEISWKKGAEGADYPQCSNEINQTITFTPYKSTDTSNSKECVLDLSSGTFDCDGIVTPLSDPVGYEISHASLIKGTNIIDADRVKGNYSGNLYFAPSEGESVLVKEDSTETLIELKDLLQVSTDEQTHAFFIADLIFADVEDPVTHEKVKPTGQFQINISGGSSPVMCNYPLGDSSFSCNGATVSVVPENLGSNDLRYTFYNMLLGDPHTMVTVKYVRDSNYFLECEKDGTLTTEDMPEVHISLAKKTSSDKADLKFSVGSPGTLSEYYGVYDKLLLGSEQDAQGSNPRYATVSIDPLQFQSGGSGNISQSGINYNVTDWTDTVRKDDTHCSVRLTGPFFAEGEGPLDRTAFTHDKVKVTLNVKDRVQFQNTHGFATVELNYDNSQVSAFNVYPTGNLKIHLAYMSGSGSRYEYKTCNYTIETGENDCGAVKTKGNNNSTGKTIVVLKDIPLMDYQYVSHQIRVEYLGDDYYASSGGSDWQYFTAENPSITLQSAKKTTSGDCGELVFRVYYGYGHGDKLTWDGNYNIISKFEAFSVNSENVAYTSHTSGSGVHTTYDIWNYPHFDSVYKGSLSTASEQYGDTFTLRWCRNGWGELKNMEYAYIAMYSQYLGYSEPFKYDPSSKPMAFVIDDSISSSSVSSASTLSASPVTLSVSIGD